MNPQLVCIEPQIDVIRDPITTVPDFGQDFTLGGTAPATVQWTDKMTVPAEVKRDDPQLVGFQIRVRSAVYDYVRMFPFLGVALSRARDMIQEQFGQACLNLEIERLPSENWEPKLVLRIATSWSLEEALLRLDSFDSQFWPGQSARIDKQLQITLE